MENLLADLRVCLTLTPSSTKNMIQEQIRFVRLVKELLDRREYELILAWDEFDCNDKKRHIAARAKQFRTALAGLMRGLSRGGLPTSRRVLDVL